MIRAPHTMEKKTNFEINAPNINKNMNGHYPLYNGLKEATWCEHAACGWKIHIKCKKCNIHLCFVKNRNCFKNYHL